jgi:hypothetical protein
MASDNNKAKIRQSKSNSAKYGAQYGITFNNKTRALTKHLTTLKAALANNTANITQSGVVWERKIRNITAAIAATEAALKSIPLKR